MTAQLERRAGCECTGISPAVVAKLLLLGIEAAPRNRAHSVSNEPDQLAAPFVVYES